MIELRSVSKIFHGSGNDYAAVRDVTLKINEGEYVLLTGKSGSGKSTLLNLLTGIDHVSSGQIRIGKTDITNLDENRMAVWRGGALGIVFQFFQLIPTLSVMENILLPMDLLGKVSPANRRRRAGELLEMVGMQRHAEKMPAMLSGGEQQRVAIARALANDVPLLVADEPTGNLDSANAGAIYDLLSDLHHAGKTILMVTHDNDDIKGASRKLVLRDGKLAGDYLLGKEAVK